MKKTPRRKILLAVDGSDQALEAVRYAGGMMPVDRTEITLFYVGTGFPEVFWDMNGNPLYRSKKKKVMGWLAKSQLVMGEFKEKAYKILEDLGFEEDAVNTSTQARKTGIVKDIIQESYRDYSAVVIGRTGMSRLKDVVIGSMARKVAYKVKHIPTVIVAGKPVFRKILIALDESIESMRAVSSVAALAGAGNPEVTLCHCLLPPSLFHIHDRSKDIDADDEEWRVYHENRFRPYMQEAVQRLVEAGISTDRIEKKFVFTRGNVIHEIIDISHSGDFSTIVVGRREEAGFFESYLRGRFSDKIIQSLEDRAVWVIS